MFKFPFPINKWFNYRVVCSRSNMTEGHNSILRTINIMNCQDIIEAHKNDSSEIHVKHILERQT